MTAPTFLPELRNRRPACRTDLAGLVPGAFHAFDSIVPKIAGARPLMAQ